MIAFSRPSISEVDKYTWRHLGSLYLPSDVLAALLCAQLTRFDEIMLGGKNCSSAYVLRDNRR
ncbi:MAG: hypothetical protein FWE27_04180 [Defluviitaleaceae bacterium]|nr:hypothetical protein [Defluviitaleaceae bacterium]